MPKCPKNSDSAWRKRKLLPVISTAFLLLSLSGCASLTGIAATRPVDTSCEAFKPISWSVKDTDETIIEVKRHNAKFAALCP